MAIPTIDFGTCHLYAEFSPAESPDAFGARWVREHIEAGQRANKPMIIEEYGMKNDSGAAARETAYEAWLGQVVASQGAGALVWMIASAGADGQPYPDYDHYTVYTFDEISAIRNFAQSPSPPDPVTGTDATAAT
jgi:mannan endo-1,4-beta-mannosidase